MPKGGQVKTFGVFSAGDALLSKLALVHELSKLGLRKGRCTWRHVLASVDGGVGK